MTSRYKNAQSVFINTIIILISYNKTRRVKKNIEIF